MATSERYSGRLLLRMPSTLHAELAQAAEREGTSLNQLIVGRLSRSVGLSGEEAEAADGPSQAGSPPVGGEAGEVATSPRQSRTLTIALAVNLVVMLVAGAIAVVLLVVAWRGGF